MPKLLWAIFCQQAVVDRFTNHISVINQFDEIHPVRPQAAAAQKPKAQGGAKPRVAAAFQCALVSLWEREKPTRSESTEMKVDLLGPKREKLAQFKVILDLRKHARTRQLTNMPGVPLAGEGTYRFVLRCRDGVKWRHTGVVAFEVKFQEPPRLH
jgi:hypothetical protein